MSNVDLETAFNGAVTTLKLKQPARVDFELIYKELKKAVRIKNAGILHIKEKYPVLYLKEFKSISISAPRQTGKTTFILKKMIEEDGILIVGHMVEKNNILTLLEEKYHDRVYVVTEFLHSKNLDFKPYQTKQIFVEADGIPNKHWLTVSLCRVYGTDIEITYIGTH